ncbi:MAG: hypothetical protein Q8916_11340 [Bacteroidota bacterium]|nr:hypothetical protein [Bacteroidota bacterium]MDP4230984.1 hypothetical protein [Bacteroidota bacterium]
MLRFFFGLLCVLSLSGVSFAQKEFTIMGIMQHTDLEGGCWYLQAKQMKYELTASPDILRTCKVEGRMLTLRVRQAPMMKSICMIGTMVEVVEVLDTVSHPHNPPFTHQTIKGTIHKTKSGCWYVQTSKKLRYELQAPVPKKFMHAGARYNRMSVVLPGSESVCGMTGVITISELDPDMKPKQAKERKSDPR